MFKKEKKFSRISLSIVFVIVFIMMFSILAYADTSLTSNSESDWVTKGWSRIHENDTFDHEKNLLRGELVALINSLFDFKDETEISFIDVNSDSHYFKEISKAYKAGYVLGKGNNIFDPGAEITKAEAYIMIAKALKLDTTKPVEQMLKFSDAADVPKWAAGEVEALTKKGFISEKNKVKPFEKITGTEAIALLEKITASEIVITPENPTEETKGNGKSPLNLLGAYFVTIENNHSTEISKAEDGITSDNIIIKLVFDRGVVRDFWENNKTQISLKGNNGNIIKSEVFRIEELDSEKEFIFIKPLENIKSGKTVNIVIGKDLKANNGNSLGEEKIISFVVK